MATLNEVTQKIEIARRVLSSVTSQATLLNDEVRRGAVFGDPDNIGRRVAALNNQINSAIDLLNEAAEEVPTTGAPISLQNQLLAQIDTIGDGLLDQQSRLNGISRLSQDNERDRDREANRPKNSSADEVQQAQNAAEDDARTQNPEKEKNIVDEENQVVPAKPTTPPTNAEKPVLKDDTNLGNQTGTSVVGGNQQTRTTTQTQSGASALDDDAVSQSRQTVGVTSSVDGRPAIAPDFLNQIVATDNKLQGLASTTYTISLYLMNAEEYRQLIASQRKVLPTKQLIVQSGGIPFGERNPWFLEDFYIEDLYIQSVIGTQAMGAPHNAVDMRFTILEPQGITFLNRLNNAVKQHTGNNQENELNQNYLMVIRFYGYDDAGQLVSGTELGVNETGSDPRSIVEKFIPFQIADINYKIGSRAVEYNVTATVPATNIGFSQGRATIPFNIQLVSPDVQTLLNGNLLLANTGGAEGEDDNTNPNTQLPGTTQLTGATITQGLCEALNKHQRLLAQKNGYQYPDIYEIELENTPGLRDAKMAKPGKQNKKRAPMNTSSDPANKFLASKSRYDKDTKTYNITAGTQIVQLIDLVMRSSSYITSQQNIIFDEKTGEIKNQDPVSTVQWYRIRCQVTPDKYDEKRRDYSYRIKYTVSRYQINTPRSAYFPPAAYRGVHKLYNYWFTGQNTEVLDFEINVNANYLTVIGNDGLSDNTASGRWFEKRVFQARPNASSQGGEGESTMPAASLSARLYNITDVANAELEIVGDPDWIQQSEVFYNKDIVLTPFLSDGSVNFDASEVLYELRFNPVNDYDLDTGLTPVYQNNTTYSQVTGETNLPQESIVWAAAVVHNYFKEGKFTQRLVGTIRDFASAVDTITGNTAVATRTETTKTTPKPPPTESGGPTVHSIAAGDVNLDVAGGTSTPQGNVGFFDNIADDDGGDQIIFSP